jgi:hypothetical protein
MRLNWISRRTELRVFPVCLCTHYVIDSPLALLYTDPLFLSLSLSLSLACANDRSPEKEKVICASSVSSHLLWAMAEPKRGVMNDAISWRSLNEGAIIDKKAGKKVHMLRMSANRTYFFVHRKVHRCSARLSSLHFPRCVHSRRYHSLSPPPSSSSSSLSLPPLACLSNQCSFQRLRASKGNGLTCD